MGRIQNAYESRLRVLLGQLGTRRAEQGVQWLLKRAHRLSREEAVPFPQALARVYARIQKQVEQYRGRSGTNPPPRLIPLQPLPRRFLCDAGLGGLARWLRAAGYETHWRPDFDDDELLAEARRGSATLLTTDSLLMERRVLRQGLIPALWIPPSMTRLEQLTWVLRELRLERREPRCMSCGGQLQPVDKESVREQIPPKTYRWLDQYFQCTVCRKLFWHGTHWEKIQQRLQNSRR